MFITMHTINVDLNGGLDQSTCDLVVLTVDSIWFLLASFLKVE